MNNLFCIKVITNGAPSTGIYIKVSSEEFDIVIISYHSILLNEAEEVYELYYFEDGESVRLEVIEDIKCKSEDIILIKVIKIEKKLRDKIEQVLLTSEIKEEEALKMIGFPEALAIDEMERQKLDVIVNEVNKSNRFHEIKYEKKYKTQSSSDNTEGFSGAPIFSKVGNFNYLKGIYLEIGSLQNVFHTGNILKGEIIKKLIEEYFPTVDINNSYVLSLVLERVEAILEEITKNISDFETIDIWQRKSDILKKSLSDNKLNLKVLLKSLSCDEVNSDLILDNHFVTNEFIRCLLSASEGLCLNDEKNSFKYKDDKYYYFNPILEGPKFPKVVMTRVFEFLSKSPIFSNGNVFIRYDVTRRTCANCFASDDVVKFGELKSSLIPEVDEKNFIYISKKNKVNFLCSACFEDTRKMLEDGGKVW